MVGATSGLGGLVLQLQRGVISEGRRRARPEGPLPLVWGGAPGPPGGDPDSTNNLREWGWR